MERSSSGGQTSRRVVNLDRAAVLFVLPDNTVIVEHQGGTVGLPGTSCADDRGRPTQMLAHHVATTFPAKAAGTLAAALRDLQRTWTVHSISGGTSYAVVIVAAQVDVSASENRVGAGLRTVGFDSTLQSRMSAVDDVLFVGYLLARVFGV